MDRKSGYFKIKWPIHEHYVKGQNNIEELALVELRKFCLFSLHLNLSLFKTLSKLLISNLQIKFPNLSDEKVKS